MKLMVITCFCIIFCVFAVCLIYPPNKKVVHLDGVTEGDNTWLLFPVFLLVLTFFLFNVIM